MRDQDVGPTRWGHDQMLLCVVMSRVRQGVQNAFKVVGLDIWNIHPLGFEGWQHRQCGGLVKLEQMPQSWC